MITSSSWAGTASCPIQLVSRARKAGLTITPRNVFQHQAVAALGRVAVAAPQPTIAVADVESGDLLPTPVMLYLRERGGPLAGFSQQMLVQTPAGLREEDLAAALQALLDRHAVLRMRLKSGGSGWELEIAEAGAVRASDSLTRVALAGRTDRRAVIDEYGAAARRRLDPKAGAMVQAVWFDAGAEEPGRLLLAIQLHLAVDGRCPGVFCCRI